MKKRKVNNNKTNTAGNVMRSIFQQELNKFEERFEAKIDIKLDFKLGELERKVDEKAIRYRDQVLTSNDKLAKQLETMRQESVVGDFQRDEKLDNHENRIKVLESSQKS